MKQFSNHSGKKILQKTSVCIFFLALTSQLLLSFTLREMVDDIWSQLGISSNDGTESIKSSFLNNYFQYYGARKAKNIATGNRAAVAKNLLAYSRKYIASDDFKNEYAALRNGAKPAEPDRKTARSKEEIRKEKIAEMEQAIKKMEIALKDMAPDMQKALKPSLELYRKQIKDYKDPENKMIDMFTEAEKLTVEQEKTQYQERLKKWEEDFPVNVNGLIKKRLTRYVTLAETVDFSAALVEKNQKNIFVNKTYESKPEDWKLIFRAGKEVYDVARPFAEQWLLELP